ncbi:ATP-dependent DNA helicase [Oceanobacillus caeni]|uniref:ATP-dependent DNA helicase n=1 Tax=Oceanobacillus caeni TaxID=405946 RepID=A0ABR5MHY7_9BACI|nr:MULTISPECIES: ATP-dependent DNA helicase RecQ [Bacillaceae]KKE79319.1 ATP-dependent DNA helicase [Bacilli bacterium VT-13-104]PZD88391.1 ATP-dependent DNA helicase RecQ [Bacilli bacterium]KPH73839.1 ATP-dependent DNA helicase [Oceanobacillus caeni]MBU8789753.1 ATP-dependent DNA helicase [Oceanobacillus caeni]MCR1834368.1 ATP-dependent DNA helicase [Oceanobacillus caeni]
MELELERELQKHFRFSTFRTGQKEIIQDVLNGNDVLGILPTGSGKSICYQLPAIMMDGLTIVVSPLISLMMDQVKEMKANHFKKVIAINSFMNFEERREIYRNIHTYKLLFISPELLSQDFIIHLLQRVKVSLFVIDEAHCISQWGYEFRPDYLKLNSIIEKLGNPPTLALSGTATPEVQADIMTSLNKPEMIKHIYPMDKPNIAFCIEEVENDQEKNDMIIQLLKKYNIPTLIYFSSRLTAESFTRFLSEKLQGRRVGFYHAGMEPMDRVMIQQQFMNNQLDIVCCTSAFGMGINKGNIRLIIHYHIPLQLESFIQEVGRAGRDGKSSVSLLLFSKSDMLLPNHLIKSELPDAKDLSNVFGYLRDLTLQDMDLPKDDVQIQNLFNLNETQWRFLRYQLEKHHLIHDNKIMDYNKTWEDIYQSIFHVINSRVKLKISKLTEIIKWIHEDRCLRDTLYQGFQPTHSGAEFQCCSNCGFTWSEWTPEQQEIESNLGLNWENKLKKLLLLDI